jgi:hypothetical protein
LFDWLNHVLPQHGLGLQDDCFLSFDLHHPCRSVLASLALISMIRLKSASLIVYPPELPLSINSSSPVKI